MKELEIKLSEEKEKVNLQNEEKNNLIKELNKTKYELEEKEHFIKLGA